MSTFNGDINSGRDTNIANRDINIYEHNEVYKPLNQCTPHELRTEQTDRLNRFNKRKRERWSYVPKWIILPFIGFFIGILFASYIQSLIGSGFSLSAIFDLLTYFTKHYTPIVPVLSIGIYMFAFWALPLRRILELLFTDDEVMRRHRKALYEIKTLLAERA